MVTLTVAGAGNIGLHVFRLWPFLSVGMAREGADREGGNVSDHSYYVRDSGAVNGPVSLSELRLKLMRGALSQDIEVLRDDESTWHAATILPELFDLFNNAGPQSTLPESPRAFRVRTKR